MEQTHLDPATEVVRRRMSHQKTANTKPERDLRSHLYGLGLRYRLHRSIDGSRRTTDIVLTRPQIAIDVHGCFWHGCPEHFVAPMNNHDFWKNKIEANRRRDLHSAESMAQLGWLHLAVWEHADMEVAAGEVLRIVRLRLGF